MDLIVDENGTERRICQVDVAIFQRDRIKTPIRVYVTSYHRGTIPTGTKIAAISTLPESSQEDTSRGQEYKRFLTYLQHGVAGTSPPKAAILEHWPLQSEQTPYKQLLLLPPKTGVTVTEKTAVIVIGISDTNSSGASASSNDLAQVATLEAIDDSKSNVYTIKDAPDNIRGKCGFLFSGIEPSIRDEMRVDDVAMYSITDWKTAETTTRILSELVGRNSVIVDGTACVGGNTLSFARCELFRHVVGVEISKQRVELLQHNVKVNGLNSKVNIVQGDYTKLFHMYPSDIVFFDPPWGGVDYKHENTIDLVLGAPPRSLGIVCREVLRYEGPHSQNTLNSAPKYIAIKAPVNLNETNFFQNLGIPVGGSRVQGKFGGVEIETVHKLRKMKLYILKRLEPIHSSESEPHAKRSRTS